MDVICCQQRPTLSPLGMPTAAPAHHHMVHTRRARDRAVQANLGEDSPVTDEAAASEETTPHVAAAAAARTPMTIADFAVSRDNNFNLIRFRAASAVLVSHSYALSTGDPKTEPLRAWLGFSAGDIAVDVFFLTSGFLVAGSLFSRRSVFSFALARALRIYPAMLVSVALTVLIVGMWFSSSAATSFITNSDTWRYIWKNATLVFGIAYKLPGAFELAKRRCRERLVVVIAVRADHVRRARCGVAGTGHAEAPTREAVQRRGGLHLPDGRERGTPRVNGAQNLRAGVAPHRDVLRRQLAVRVQAPSSARCSTLRSAAARAGRVVDEQGRVRSRLSLQPALSRDLSRLRAWRRAAPLQPARRLLLRHLHLRVPGAADARGASARYSASADAGRFVPHHIAAGDRFVAFGRKASVGTEKARSSNTSRRSQGATVARIGTRPGVHTGRRVRAVQTLRRWHHRFGQPQVRCR